MPIKVQVLTLVIVVLVIGSAVQHPVNLQDVRITIVAVELIASAIEAQDKLVGLVSSPWGRTHVPIHVGFVAWGSAG